MNMLLDLKFEEPIELSGGHPCVVASPEMVSQLLRSATQAIDTDAGAALGYIKQAVSLLEVPVGLQNDGSNRGGLAHWQVERVKRHIETNLEGAIRVVELACIVNLSCGYFSKAFKLTFGVSPHAYVVARRLQRAMELMTLTCASLCEIAFACGFSDQPHLCRQFRRVTGVSPNVWRRSRVDGFVSRQ
ncbi:helix-turn-helix domain-containing protein [Tardiphaga sp. 866_E4_N2_1]|uniref:helix-turn-helix domain-containing protein n=1 Tax=unclassified Tardiphaga TaxID=2631404 RepID=UPI003F26B635